ncbi:hypothetical protein [Rhodopila sp.]|uniref:hypothetical protein n=1 Tax=Rhodopila sp. TaxID=2480087 RepID=UPI003D146B74
MSPPKELIRDPTSDLARALTDHLTGELRDPRMAAELAAAMRQCSLDWTAPTVAAGDIDTIVAFTFGNRLHANGNRSPGPVNQQLADLTLQLHEATNARVFAQWEVADAIGTRMPQASLVAINPIRDDRGEPVYLSTAGVLDAIALLADPPSLGTVGVIAFADHLFRCVANARQAGFTAAAPAGLAMPDHYDALSGQPWCRDRLAYLLHDIMIRVTERRAETLARDAG